MPPKESPRITRPPADGPESVDRAAAVLDLVARQHPNVASLTDLVVQSGLAQPTVHRLLAALTRSGLVEHDRNSRRYHFGLETYVLGSLASHRFGVSRIAAGSVDRIARLSEDTAFLTERRGALAICSLRVQGGYPVRADVLSAGDRHPLGIGACSIANLAALPDTEVEEILAANETRYLDRYQPVTPAVLRELVTEARSRGHALHRGLVHPGAWGMGVAIRDPKGIRSQRCRSELWSTGSASSGSATCAPRCAKSRIEAQFAQLAQPRTSKRRQSVPHPLQDRRGSPRRECRARNQEKRP